ncbi:hypothetical protein C1H46_020858 [Malus baccata]|uniref:Uncharacterized protein n=1 Tax=Malus baccata TaxID=106549 RepID=A0A540M440_MALBA|nr:hypothetical protein C1H46_020858 [Malus baccata]
MSGNRKISSGYLQEYSQEMKKELPIDKIPNRRVSIFTPGWEISVGVKTTDLSQLILKEWKKKKHEQWRMKKAVEELKPSTTPHIIRIWNKVQKIRNKIAFFYQFYKHHTRLKVQRLKYKIKYSKSNWSKSIAMGKLSKLKVFRLNCLQSLYLGLSIIMRYSHLNQLDFLIYHHCLQINHENLKHQVQANGWQAWRKDEKLDN